MDGVLVAQDTTSPIASVRTSTVTGIGYIASDFVGSIDEVRVFSRALSASEIAALASSATSNAKSSGTNLLLAATGTFAAPGGHTVLSIALTMAGLFGVLARVSGKQDGTKSIFHPVCRCRIKGWRCIDSDAKEDSRRRLVWV